jgi:hypothetical protein
LRHAAVLHAGDPVARAARRGRRRGPRPGAHVSSLIGRARERVVGSCARRFYVE